MGSIDKKVLNEREICTKFVTPALSQVGWDLLSQIREQFKITKGRVQIEGGYYTRTPPKFADYVLFYRSYVPLAIIEAKDNKHSVGHGMQQALTYAEMLDTPFVYSTNGALTKSRHVTLWASHWINLTFLFLLRAKKLIPNKSIGEVRGVATPNGYLPCERENMKRWHVAGDDPGHSADSVS